MNNTVLLVSGAAVVIACVVIAVAAQWKIFVKAGRPGWVAFIPIYDSWVLFEVAGKPGWWALFGLIPYLGWVVVYILYIIAAPELARRFGKDMRFAVIGLILFQAVGLIVLGFGDAEYDTSQLKEQSFSSPDTE